MSEAHPGQPPPPAGPAPLFAGPQDGVLDFSEPDRPASIAFRVGPAADDVFHAAGALPAGVALELTAAARALTADDAAAEKLLGLLRQVLLDQDGERFTARLSDPARPISLPQLVRIIQGLLGAWGLRPTPPPPGSSPGPASQDGGTSSMAGSLWQAPTP